MQQPIRAFLAMPFRPELRWIRNAVAASTRRLQIELVVADEAVAPGGDILATIRHEIRRSTFAYVVLTDLNPNVMYELGLLHEASKPTILLADKDTMKRLPFDIRGLMTVTLEAATPAEDALTNVLGNATGSLLRLFDDDTRSAIALGKELEPAPFFSTAQLIVANYDFERLKDSAAKAVGRRGCRTTNVSSHSDGGFRGWRLRARCSGGDSITVLIDLNGEIVEVDVA